MFFNIKFGLVHNILIKNNQSRHHHMEFGQKIEQRLLARLKTGHLKISREYLMTRSNTVKCNECTTQITV